MKTFRSRLAKMNPMWWFLPPFAVILAANMVMVVMAVDSFGGITDNKAYEKGLAYNQTLDAREAMAGLGWQVGWQLDDRGSGLARVVVDVADAAGQPLEGVEVAMVVTRPVGVSATMVVPLVEDAAGRFAGEMRLPMAGQWEAAVTVRRGGDEYETQQRFSVR